MAPRGKWQQQYAFTSETAVQSPMLTTRAQSACPRLARQKAGLAAPLHLRTTTYGPPASATRHFLQPVSAECAAFASSGWLRKQHNMYTFYVTGSTLDSLPGGDGKTCTPCTDCRHQTYCHQMLTNT